MPLAFTPADASVQSSPLLSHSFPDVEGADEQIHDRGALRQLGVERGRDDVALAHEHRVLAPPASTRTPGPMEVTRGARMKTPSDRRRRVLGRGDVQLCDGRVDLPPVRVAVHDERRAGRASAGRGRSPRGRAGSPPRRCRAPAARSRPRPRRRSSSPALVHELEHRRALAAGKHEAGEAGEVGGDAHLGGRDAARASAVRCALEVALQGEHADPQPVAPHSPPPAWQSISSGVSLRDVEPAHAPRRGPR